METYTKVVLYTGSDGYARFREEPVPLEGGKPAARLSALMPSGGYQLRRSPPGFRSEFHCTEHPQWVFILGGRMEIGLQDGTSRVFAPGQHFHSADVADGSLEVQQARFREALALLPARPQVLHAENSPAVERQSPSPWDVVRPGVFLYGVGGGPGSALQPDGVAHLRAEVVELHEVRGGEGVSYGATWRAAGPRRVATLAIGYADGYRRLFSSRGEVLIRGRRAPVVGRVTMDMTMVDVTGVGCDVGDAATLLGRGGDDQLDINEVSAAVDLLPYELLVGLRLRVPRLYLGAPPRLHDTLPPRDVPHHSLADRIDSTRGATT